MRIPADVIEEAHLGLRRAIAGWGRRVASSQPVTLQQAGAAVAKRIAGGGGASVALYVVAIAEDADGNAYTRYLGDDGLAYTEEHATGKVYNA
jgi:hypothetical protein